jgi:hypothetical protein
MTIETAKARMSRNRKLALIFIAWAIVFYVAGGLLNG